MGHVSEVGNSALTRSSGTTTTTSGTSQEAKDFKVVVTLDDPPQELRPGLSTTATIVTATRQHVLTVPIQALTIREFDADADAIKNDPTKNKKKVEKEGVFTLKNGIALFRQVKTGITGTTDIEILDGVAENDDIVSGPYQVLRTLKDNTRIKIEKAP
jgi:HlyD family secretion protein